MKRLLFFIAIGVCLVPKLWSQDTVHFWIYDGIEDGTLKRAIEQNTSRLLTSINIAEARGCDINYDGIGISNNAAQRIGALWRNIHVHIVDDEIAESCICIKTRTGDIIAYEVRNIKIIMRPLGEGYEGDLNQEVSIYFNQEGVICDFNITLGNGLYHDIFEEGRRLDDLYCRLQILHWVEQFYSAYIQKDIDFFNTVCDDDVLIVTESVLMRTNTEENQQIDRKICTREQYLSNLSRTLTSNSYINVKFDSIKIRRHPVNHNFYGVTILQNWNGETANVSIYADEGTFFSVWDFTDEQKPQIRIFTWQPISDPNPTFNLSDFKI